MAGVYVLWFAFQLPDMIFFQEGKVGLFPDMHLSASSMLRFIIQIFVLGLCFGIIPTKYLTKRRLARSISQLKQGSDKPANVLSPRELEIFHILKKNTHISLKELSAKLNIGENTVKTHINSIYKKLKISNRKELASKFNELNS